MAEKDRKHVSTHFVIRTVVEEVVTTGEMPYQGDVPIPGTINRDVREVGNFVTKDKNLPAAIEKATGHLKLIGD